ncbi:Septin-2 [Dactylellina cionopaga]|nr:Septin-2 [Dactylellina cionopaga]
MSKKIKKNQPPLPPTVPQTPPRLPELDIVKVTSSPMRTFGGASSDNQPSSPPSQGLPKPSIDLASRNTDQSGNTKHENVKPGFDVTQDPFQNVSITNRGRYSYASSAVSTIHGPRRLRKRKDPVPFNILVIGARGSGKSSFVQFLRYALGNPSKSHKKGIANGGTAGFSYTEDLEDPQNPVFDDKDENDVFQKSYIETDIDGERVGITIWDSDGLEKSVVDLQLREIVGFIENKFEETFNEETRVSRIPGNKDSHIHCTFLLMDPSRLDTGASKSIRRGPKSTKDVPGEGLDEDLDLQVFRALNGKTTVIPVISKADACTLNQMTQLKGLVIKSLHNSKMDPINNLDLDLDYSSAATSKPTSAQPKKTPKDSLPEADEESENGSASSDDESEVGSEPGSIPAVNIIPFSVISPDHYGSESIGRQYPWGVADPFNSRHCDFLKLKEAVFSDWRADLRESSRDIWYENWRTSRLSKPARKVNTNGRGY